MLLKTILSLVLAVGPVAAPATPDIPAAELHSRLAALAAGRDITAGLIHVRNGRGQWSDAVGVRDLSSGAPAAADGHFRIGSVTKTFAATVLLQLVDERRLALDDPIERHLPGVVPDGGRVTVRHVLQHTSGLHDYMSEPGYSTNRWRADARFDDYTPSQLLKVAFAKGPDFENPGESWHYSNTNYVVAGLLVEKLTGHSYGEEVSRRILRPLDLRNTSVPGHRPSLPAPHARGYEPLPTTPATIVDATDMDPSLDWAAGEMISTTRDLTTFVTALLQGRLTSKQSLAEMRRMRDAVPLFRYGLGLQEFAIPCADGPKPVWGHTGQLIGYVTVAFTDGKGKSLTLSLNPYEQDPPTEAVVSMAAAVFCR
ncbi:serine hydrolase domain-containing protein [Amycolatopsis azurea]|uniref:Alkaline D-peptidase n=1 Tax=Amycolatopsis azurea DSM 43854 TaxID=1238180 RepID=M2QIU8_9PSEU|nr:serine hydrolase domain-containing protein [Amycolatopsis azurea]EMD26636.1 D-alanyl-D-alanine carboxypeptidase [Amycolatopsis azurea DSM 43854]OOC01070.1 alkaline D-peptidase [Amycolatopsis azurea DSM 43854]